MLIVAQGDVDIVDVVSGAQDPTKGLKRDGKASFWLGNCISGAGFFIDDKAAFGKFSSFGQLPDVVLSLGVFFIPMGFSFVGCDSLIDDADSILGLSKEIGAFPIREGPK